MAPSRYRHICTIVPLYHQKKKTGILHIPIATLKGFPQQTFIQYLYVSQLCDGYNLAYKVNGLCPSGTQSTKEEWGKGK